MAIPETLKEWKIAITSVGQEYKFTEGRQDYQTETGMTYRGRDTSMDIGKARDNFDRNRKPKCFNCNTYGHMAKDCWGLKKEKDTRKCYKCDKIVHIAKNYRAGSKIKNQSI